ncbi:MAG: hypothetical protein IJS62_04745 [Bacteroidales bacterium]|nr:hypothetical protein [Bacteroidales bacterium]
MKKNITYFPPKAHIEKMLDLKPTICTSYDDIVTMSDQLEDDALDW